MDEPSQGVRVDRWLWAARFFKTRSLAARAIAGGKVHVNGRRVKRATMVRVGDRMTVRKGANEFQLLVSRLSEHRGPAREATALYEETAESQRARERLAVQRKAAPFFSFREGGRPTKKERRALDRLRRGGLDDE